MRTQKKSLFKLRKQHLYFYSNALDFKSVMKRRSSLEITKEMTMSCISRRKS